MGLQMTDFRRNGVLCKTDRGLVDLDKYNPEKPHTIVNLT